MPAHKMLVLCIKKKTHTYIQNLARGFERGRRQSPVQKKKKKSPGGLALAKNLPQEATTVVLHSVQTPEGRPLCCDNPAASAPRKRAAAVERTNYDSRVALFLPLTPKSACPGVSTTLSTCSPQVRRVTLLMIVIPRSRSRSLLPRYDISSAGDIWMRLKEIAQRRACHKIQREYICHCKELLEPSCEARKGGGFRRGSGVGVRETGPAGFAPQNREGDLRFCTICRACAAKRFRGRSEGRVLRITGVLFIVSNTETINRWIHEGKGTILD